MDRRLDLRYSTDAGLAAGLPQIEVRVTTLAHPPQTGLGRMTDISESGMGVAVRFALSPGDIVQIDADDTRLFGFVVHAAPQDNEYRAGIELQRVLIGGSDLSRLLHLALRRALPELPGVLNANLSL